MEQQPINIEEVKVMDNFWEKLRIEKAIYLLYELWGMTFLTIAINI